MDVILLERVENLGQMGEVVKVKPGYARNYLLPQKKALRATKGNLEHFESQRAQLEADNLKRREEAEKVAAKLEGLSVFLQRQAGESGQLYGSVNAQDLATAVTEAGVTHQRKLRSSPRRYCRSTVRSSSRSRTPSASRVCGCPREAKRGL